MTVYIPSPFLRAKGGRSGPLSAQGTRVVYLRAYAMALEKTIETLLIFPPPAPLSERDGLEFGRDMRRTIRLEVAKVFRRMVDVVKE